MNNDVVPVKVLAVLPTEHQTVAVFIGNEEKSFIINVEGAVGRAIALAMRGVKHERPLTHELINLIFNAFSIKVDHVVINDLADNTYFARVILRADNEVHKKVVELDARPSDCIAIALQTQSPIFVSERVWMEVEDMSELLEKMESFLRKKKSPPDEPDFGKDLE